MKNVKLVDQPRWAALDAEAYPATMSFRMVWTATDEKFVYDNPSQHFRVEGFRATAQLEAEVKSPHLKFSWKSDPLSTSSSAFAIIGTEVNGRYYDEMK
jgi:hypothetical protein